MDVPGFQAPDRRQIEGQKENQCGEKKGKHISAQGIFRLIGIHPHSHQTVGPEVSQSLVREQHAKNTANQGNTDGKGKASY